MHLWAQSLGGPSFGSRGPASSSWRVARTHVRPPMPRNVHGRTLWFCASRSQRRAILDGYRQGKSARNLAGAFDVSRASIDALVLDAGIPRQTPKMTDDEQQRAIALYQSGLSTYAVGRERGRSQSSVWLLVKCQGIPTHSGIDG